MGVEVGVEEAEAEAESFCSVPLNLSEAVLTIAALCALSSLTFFLLSCASILSKTMLTICLNVPLAVVRLTALLLSKCM